MHTVHKTIAGCLAAVALLTPTRSMGQTAHNALQDAKAIDASAFVRPQTASPEKAYEPGEKVGHVLSVKSSQKKAPRQLAVRKAAAGTPLPHIVASVVDQATGQSGMYRLPATVGGQMTRLTSSVTSFYGGVLVGDTYYANSTGLAIQAYDVNTWEPVGAPFGDFGTDSDQYAYPLDLSVDPVSGQAYGYTDSGEHSYSFYFCSVDLNTGVVTGLSGFTWPDEVLRAVAFDPAGELYGLSREGIAHLDISGSKPVYELLYSHPLTMSIDYAQTAGFDPVTGEMYFIHNRANNYGSDLATLYRVDLATGELVELCDLGNFIVTGMVFPADAKITGAPARPDGVTAQFAGGSLTGQVKFTIPATLVGGQAGSGQVTYTVSDGLDVLATGTGAYGTRQSVTVTVDGSGYHYLSVSLANAAGTSERAALSQWFGPDTPAAVTGLQSDYTDGTFALSWNPVTTGAHKGYVDPAAVTYRVTRQPEGTVVADGLTTPSYTYAYVPEGLAHIYHTVEAVCGGLTSVPAATEAISAGAINPPYAPDYKELGKEAFVDWTIIDGDGDDDTFEYYDAYYTRGLRLYTMNYSGDDWAVTPPVKMIAGNRYPMKLTIANRRDPEKFEVMMGAAPTPEAMTITLMPETVQTGSGKTSDYQEVTYSLEAMPETDGIYYVGVHCLSDGADAWNFFVCGIKLETPVALAAPESPTGMTVTPDPTGLLKATVTLTAPVLDTTGATLTSLSRIEILRDGTLIHTLHNPAPGSVVTYTDEDAGTFGMKHYTAVAYFGEHGSYPAQADAYVGPAVPAAPTDLGLVENADGTLTLTWTEPVTDNEGRPIYNGLLSYNVYVYRDNYVYTARQTFTGLTGNTLTFTPELAEGMDHGFIYCKVDAVTEAGASWSTSQSPNIPVGAAADAPFAESFPDSQLEHLWGDGATNFMVLSSITDDRTNMHDYNGWNRVTDASFTSADGAQDGDNGFAAMFGYAYDDDRYPGGRLEEYHELLSKKINLATVANPVLSFWLWNWDISEKTNPNLFDVEVIDCATKERVNIFHTVHQDLGPKGWHHVTLPLTAWNGKTVSLVFTGTVKDNYNWIMIDNISVYDAVSTDLAVSGISAPVKVTAGTPFTVSALVDNIGYETVTAYDAVLLHNDTEVATKQCGPIAVGEKQTVEFNVALGASDPIGNTYRVRIDAAGDAVPGNNLSAIANVARETAVLPAPRNPRAADGSIVWEAPDLVNIPPKAVTEDFESYEPYTSVPDGWVFEDRDNAPVGGIIDSSTGMLLEFPGIEMRTPQSWWIQHASTPGFNYTYEAHSGSMYIANMYNWDGVSPRATACDDWAISPELYGIEQMISLFARSYSKATPETFEVLWSDGSVNPDDFRSIQVYDDISVDWTEYYFVVPAGAKRFAIRGISDEPMGTAQTFVDDVTFIPATGERPVLHLLGYNVYHNGERVNTAAVEGLTYTPAAGEDADNCAVSALFTEGESRAVPVGEVGITAPSGRDISVLGGRGIVIIDGLVAEAYMLCDAAGRVLAAGEGTGHVELAAAPGIYLVKAGATFTKVVVR